MVREPLKLLFLIVSYNFVLIYVSELSSVPLFPLSEEDILLLLSYSSALYLSWLFGYRERTVVLLAYVYLFQVLGLALIRQDYYTVSEFFPSLLLNLFLIWLFESPVERRTKALEEERKKLEQELAKNEQEISGLCQQINLLKEITDRLNKEKEFVEREYARLKEEEHGEKEALEREKEELSRKLQESQKRLQDYMERLEKLTSINRELFRMLEALQEREPKGGKEELARLRQERKRLSKELLQLQELLEDLSRENLKLSKEQEELIQALEKERREKELLKLQVDNLKVKWEGRKETYREVLEGLLENLEIEDRALRDFIELGPQAKREFLKELFLLNMKGVEERFETMKGYRNVFKLKPAGGRIYFTFGEDRRWRVIGLLWGEDDKLKDRYAKELLVKYKP
ncbi:MAG: hypothetical protein N3C13_01775 [Aquificaceae bacterium]|nr:hypothetical protein [Aquificaceae bacterium]